jgi:hypothetical protein
MRRWNAVENAIVDAVEFIRRLIRQTRSNGFGPTRFNVFRVADREFIRGCHSRLPFADPIRNRHSQPPSSRNAHPPGVGWGAVGTSSNAPPDRRRERRRERHRRRRRMNSTADTANPFKRVPSNTF